MRVNISRVDTSLPLPQYETAGAVGFDLYSRVDMEIAAHQIALIPTNVVIETPPGYMLVVVPRSSTPRKKGLSIPHGLGVIDQDYCGPEDEVMFQIYNFTDSKVSIERGERIAQGIFVRVDRGEFEEVSQIERETRGGFGATDKEA